MDKKDPKQPKKKYNFRKRYLAFEISSKNRLDFAKVERAITARIQGLPIRVINKWEPKMQRGILRTGHQSVNAMVESLQGISNINHDDVHIRALGTSGTLRKAVDKYIKIAG